MRPIRCYLGLSMVIFLGCGVSDSNPVADARIPGSGGPETPGNVEAINALRTQLRGREYKLIDSVLVLKNGAMVFEQYRNGYGPTKTHDIASITKSVTSLLIGIAIDQGHITDVDQPVVDFFAETPYADSWPEDKRSITIRHLLTMQHGIACDDHDDPGMKRFKAWMRSSDRIASLLRMPMDMKPGTASTYCTASTQLLQQVIEQSTGQSVDRFATERLFEPLGIESFQWERSSNQGIAMGFGADTCSRDLAVLGRMIQQGGKWNGEQIVSSTWLQESFEPRGKLLGIDYGYLWYGEPYSSGERKLESKLAMGHGGQFLILIPELESIIVIFASDYDQEIDFYQLIQDFMIPICL